MARKHKKSFTPCRLTRNDETFNFLAVTWNITEMKNWVEEHKDELAIVNVAVGPWYNFIYKIIRINKDRLTEVNLDNPVIMAYIGDTSCLILDGNHRIVKAHNEGLKTLKGYCLSFEQQLQFVTNEFAYEALIKIRKEEQEHDRVRSEA